MPALRRIIERFDTTEPLNQLDFPGRLEALGFNLHDRGGIVDCCDFLGRVERADAVVVGIESKVVFGKLLGDILMPALDDLDMFVGRVTNLVDLLGDLPVRNSLSRPFLMSPLEIMRDPFGIVVGTS